MRGGQAVDRFESGEIISPGFGLAVRAAQNFRTPHQPGLLALQAGRHGVDARERGVGFVQRQFRVHGGQLQRDDGAEPADALVQSANRLLRFAEHAPRGGAFDV